MDDYSWWWAADALCDEWAELKTMSPEEKKAVLWRRWTAMKKGKSRMRARAIS
jgi:hypothetical protein